MGRDAQGAARTSGRGAGSEGAERCRRKFLRFFPGGFRDEKYVALATAMAERIPDAHVVTVRGAGHSVSLEKPEVVAGALIAG